MYPKGFAGPLQQIPERGKDVQDVKGELGPNERDWVQVSILLVGGLFVFYLGGSGAFDLVREVTS